jgi:hypothetical protein
MKRRATTIVNRHAIVVSLVVAIAIADWSVADNSSEGELWLPTALSASVGCLAFAMFAKKRLESGNATTRWHIWSLVVQWAPPALTASTLCFLSVVVFHLPPWHAPADELDTITIAVDGLGLLAVLRSLAIWLAIFLTAFLVDRLWIKVNRGHVPVVHVSGTATMFYGFSGVIFAASWTLELAFVGVLNPGLPQQPSIYVLVDGSKSPDIGLRAGLRGPELVDPGDVYIWIEESGISGSFTVLLPVSEWRPGEEEVRRLERFSRLDNYSFGNDDSCAGNFVDSEAAADSEAGDFYEVTLDARNPDVWVEPIVSMSAPNSTGRSVTPPAIRAWAPRNCGNSESMSVELVTGRVDDPSTRIAMAPGSISPDEESRGKLSWTREKNLGDDDPIDEVEVSAIYTIETSASRTKSVLWLTVSAALIGALAGQAVVILERQGQRRSVVASPPDEDAGEFDT